MFILKNKEVPEIRIIPMSTMQFDYKSIKEVQQEYFLMKLIYKDNCKYYCGERTIDSKDGSLLLFQYSNKLIASAQFEYAIKEDIKSIVVYKDTIQIFEPIEKAELEKMGVRFNWRSNCKARIDIKLKHIIQLLEQKKKQYNMTYQEKVLSSVVIDENFEDIPKDRSELQKKIINQWHRDPMVAKRALINAKFKCTIDSSHEHFIAKSTGENYVESHHLIPMKYQEKFHNSLDVESNIVSLCAVCHKKLHHAELSEKRDMIHILFKKRKASLERCEIYISFDELLELYK